MDVEGIGEFGGADVAEGGESIVGSESEACEGIEGMVGEMIADETACTGERIWDARRLDTVTGVDCVAGNGGVGGLEREDAILADLQGVARDEGDCWGIEGVRLGGELMADLLEEATTS